MPRKRHTPEQVINKLREAEVVISGGGTVAGASRNKQTATSLRPNHSESSRSH